MRQQKSLIALLQGMVDLLATESARNPAFAAALDEVLAALPEPKAKPPKTREAAAPADLPDIHAEWTARGEHGFRAWLVDLPVPTLKAIIRAEDLDGARRTARWSKADKLAAFVAEGLAARLSRGGAFLRGTPA